MPHTIYKTDAFVLGSVPRGEASAVFSLFTESHGLIAARAQSVRRHNGKLKHALNRYHKASCSLVSGKLGWRLIDAEAQSLPADLLSSEIKREIYAKILLLVGRFEGIETHGGGALYTHVSDMISFLGKHSFTDADKEALEILTALFLLEHLGYVSPGEVQDVFKDESSVTLFDIHTWHPELFAPLKKNARSLIALINKGITASNL